MLCPVCHSSAFAFGPPDVHGGERYKINALYCESCGYVWEVFSFARDQLYGAKLVKDYKSEIFSEQPRRFYIG